MERLEVYVLCDFLRTYSDYSRKYDYHDFSSGDLVYVLCGAI